MTISVKQNNTYAAATGVWVKVNGVWKQVASDGIEGLQGWATITAVTGSPKRYTYSDGGTSWVAFEWTGDGSLRTQAGGLMDCLVVAGGASGGTGSWGGGGAFITGIQSFGSSPLTVKVGAGATAPATNAGWSQLGDFKPNGPTTVSTGGGQHIGYPGGDPAAGFPSSITGTQKPYAQSNLPSPVANTGSGANEGRGSAPWKPGASGVVIVRVPAAQAAGVSAGTWVTRVDYYAEVTDGIVTDLYQERFYGDDTVRTENGSYASPEQPDDLIPCDPSVAEGWTYADGEFTPPPPDPSWREEAIAALKQQIKDLQKDQA